MTAPNLPKHTYVNSYNANDAQHPPYPTILAAPFAGVDVSSSFPDEQHSGIVNHYDSDDYEKRTSLDEKHTDLGRLRQDIPRRSSSASISTQREVPRDLEAATRVSTDAEGNVYPEGGREAYLCVFGSFCGCVLSLGMMNTISIYHAYIETHQLAGQSSSKIGWIFGIYAFLSFFCGLQVGPIFDAKGPRWLVFSGSVLILLSTLLLGVCTKYWHFILVFSLLGGLGTSLVFTPSVAAVGHFFLIKRGQWTGLACVGGSFGGIIFPLMLQQLLPKIGWAWSTRAVALVDLVCAIMANLFVRSRLPHKKATKEAILPDPRIFRDTTFTLATIGVFFVEWGLFVPLGYLTSYALQSGIDSTYSYQLIAIFNAGSCFGRYIPGYMADMFGRFNSLTLTAIICWISAFVFWLPANGGVALTTIFAVVFGFGSGSGISLIPVCVGQLCKTENYGRYYATCYTVVSFATLTGIPIGGAIIGACNGEYWGLIVFTGVSYAVATAIFLVARVLKVGWRLRIMF